MQRDAKGRFASTAQKRNTTTPEPKDSEMLLTLRDLAHLQAAEDHLRATLGSDCWYDLEEHFVFERRTILEPYLQDPDATLEQ